MNILGFIPARKGSKGIPGKNFKKLNGHTYGPVLDLYLTWCSTDEQIHDPHYLQMALALPLLASLK